MIYLGIDPGRHGAIAILNAAANELTVHDMPDTTAALHDLIAGLPIVKIALLEKPFFPRMIGISNAVTLARSGLGTIIALLVAKRKIPLYYGSSFSYITKSITRAN